MKERPVRDPIEGRGVPDREYGRQGRVGHSRQVCIFGNEWAEKDSLALYEHCARTTGHFTDGRRARAIVGRPEHVHGRVPKVGLGLGIRVPNHVHEIEPTRDSVEYVEEHVPTTEVLKLDLEDVQLGRVENLPRTG